VGDQRQADRVDPDPDRCLRAARPGVPPRARWQARRQAARDLAAPAVAGSGIQSSNTALLAGIPSPRENRPMSQPPARSRRIGGALAVGAGIFLSKIAGLIRDRVFGYCLGLSAAAGAFRGALRIPNLLQNLLGEGVLSASFIPVYARLVAEG